MENLIHKLIQSLSKRGMTKQSSFLEDILIQESPTNRLLTQCPICDNDAPEEDCILCDGTGVLLSINTPDDEDDERVKKELNIK